MEEIKIIYGLNPVKEYIGLGYKGTLYLPTGKLNHRQEEIVTLANNRQMKLILIDDFNTRYQDLDHQGVIIVTSGTNEFIIDENEFYAEIKKDSQDQDATDTILMLDGIKDIGNLGAILRSALLFGVHHVILPKNNAASLTETTIKRSAGAALHLKTVYVTNLTRTINFLKEQGYWIYGADMAGESIKDFSYANKTVLVMGDEGEGIRKLVKSNCDLLIRIPNNNRLDSFNVSVSAGILLYDRFIKQ